MHMDEGSKNESGKPTGYSALLPESEVCPRCGRTIFYRVTIGRQAYVVHGDKSICAAGSLEP